MLRSALAVGSLCIAIATQEPARGIVVDAAGRPVQGALLFSWWSDDQMVTGADGVFVAPWTAGVVRILADGFAPRIVSSAAFGEPIVLRAASTPRRDLPRCRAGERDRDVGDLRIPITAGVRVAGTGQDDYVGTTWSRGEAQLRHDYGPTLSAGLPIQPVLAELTDVDDRDVRLVLDADHQEVVPITDVRGRLANGRRYRYVGMFGELFEYSGLTDADAAFFDRMLDAMCYAVSEPSGQQPPK
jgi:hypothetical protein